MNEDNLLSVYIAIAVFFAMAARIQLLLLPTFSITSLLLDFYYPQLVEQMCSAKSTES